MIFAPPSGASVCEEVARFPRAYVRTAHFDPNHTKKKIQPKAIVDANEINGFRRILCIKST
jgi:hypothetical protein